VLDVDQAIPTDTILSRSTDKDLSRHKPRRDTGSRSAS
jgi:hypothetical protein